MLERAIRNWEAFLFVLKHGAECGAFGQLVGRTEAARGNVEGLSGWFQVLTRGEAQISIRRILRSSPIERRTCSIYRETDSPQLRLNTKRHYDSPRRGAQPLTVQHRHAAIWWRRSKQQCRQRLTFPTISISAERSNVRLATKVQFRHTMRRPDAGTLRRRKTLRVRSSGQLC